MKPTSTIFDVRLQAGRDDSNNPRQLRCAAIDGAEDQGRLVVIMLGQDPDGNPVQVACDAEGRLKSSGTLVAHVDDVEAFLADTYYKRLKLYNYASDRVKYVCKNTDIDANETDADWSIWKCTDADALAKEGPRSGAVDTEAGIDALGWNI